MCKVLKVFYWSGGKKNLATARSFRRFLSDCSERRKELAFPVGLCILVNSTFHAVRPSADPSSPLASVTNPLGMLSPVQIANLAIFDYHRL
jgi:hypothetical protein